jgi:fumarate reductase iron-sulfur subunit
MGKQGTGIVSAVTISNLVRREIQTPVAACLLQGFVEALGYEQAMQIAASAIQADGMKTGKLMAERYGGNSMTELLRMVREVWAEEDALEFDILEETEQMLSFNVTRCRYAELYERLGVKEFGYCLSCNRDEPLTKGFNPRMRLVRTQTIMEGADFCDFRFVFK